MFSRIILIFIATASPETCCWTSSTTNSITLKFTTMSQTPVVSFGAQAQGIQVGQNYGSINTEFHLPLERPETPPQPCENIRFSRDPDFVDRGDILDQIDKRCSEPAGRVALVGLGGVGKSQLAIEYAHRIAAKQPDKWVFWVHAGTKARVEEGFRLIADAVKLAGRNQPKADIPRLAYSWLSNERNGKWILVLDSADDGDVFYNVDHTSSATSSDTGDRRPFATYLPQSRNGSILITARNKDLASRLTGGRQNMIDVGPMAQADALTLLEKKLGSPANPDVAADLVEALDLVPLAISQAAAYIQARAPRTSAEKYLAEFRKNEGRRARLLGYDGGELRREGGASNAILMTWRISFEHIQSKRPSAADLLSLMSFFDPQSIPGWVLRPSRTTNTTQVGNPNEAGDGVSDDGFEDDLAMLRDYCLIATTGTEDEFEMHGLVQLSTKKWLEEFERRETFEQRFIERIAASFPTEEYENWAICQGLFAHVQVALDCRPSGETAETWATLLFNGGWYAFSQGQYQVAQQMVGKAWEVFERRFGREDLMTLRSISLFALVQGNQGKWSDAEELFLQVMETRKTKLGADHPETLASIANLASTYRKQGRWSEAEKLFLQVIETRKTKLGADHPETLASIANLASTYRKQGRWSEAEKLFLQVMETFKTKLGADHPSTLASMANLASTLWNQGRWSEAEKLDVQVIETFKTKLGADHPDTLMSIANLAFTWKSQGRRADALALMEDCAQARRRVLGEEHPDTLSSLAKIVEWRS
ncbi:P-loop containing nucleoside triphosphate hydrolase protein [Chaetomium sp. MPI-SDFR-AT-0129]|nr:P-loop containing nucleoside triphosphate hydrolase protein [Chaetomium sp. MPI-SDFR-AT-0129]